MKSALDFLALQGFNCELKDKQKKTVMKILCGGKSLVFQMVRLDRSCDLPTEKHCVAKRFKFKQKFQTCQESPLLHLDLYTKANYFLVLDMPIFLSISFW